MLLHRAISFAAILGLTLTLSACFVASTTLPETSGPVSDPHLVGGTWRSVDEDGKVQEDDVALQFQRSTANQPLRLTWVEDKKTMTYDVYTFVLGGKNVFAARLTGPADAMKEKDMAAGYFLGFYTFTGANDVAFQLLSSEKTNALIAKGALHGKPSADKYGIAVLTGSPSELAHFLASPAADAARAEDVTHLRRLPH